MKTVLYRWFAVAMLLALPTIVLAQHEKPAVVVCVSSVSETLSDVAYLTKAAGAADIGKTAALFGGAFTQGIDKTRPIIILLSPVDEEFQAVGCIPMKDLKQTLELFKEQIGEPRDAGDGVLEVGTNQTFYIKEVGDWAFTAQQFSHLKHVPADPTALVGDLPKKYNISVQLNVRNIPAHMREWAVDEIRNGYEQAASRNLPDDEDAAELQRKIGDSSIENITRLINEADKVTVGLAVEPTTKSTYLDVAVTAVEGSSLAKEMAVYSNLTTNFGGFVQPDGAVTLNFSGPIGEDDAAQLSGLIVEGQKKALNKIDNDPNLDANGRTVAKEVLESLFSVLASTIKEGKLDGGAILLLDERKIDFAAGVRVADGAKIEQSFRKLVELAKNDPEFPTVKLDAAKYAGISFHKLTAKIPAHETEARDLFGETIDVYLGTGPKSIYVASGKNAESLVKRVIDQSTSVADQQVSPLRLSFALLPFLKFARSMDDNPELKEIVGVLEANIEAGDKIRINSTAIDRGSQVRFEIDEGIIKLIGVGAQKAGVKIPAVQ